MQIDGCQRAILAVAKSMQGYLGKDFSQRFNKLSSGTGKPADGFWTFFLA
jgi:hypothetical protein